MKVIASEAREVSYTEWWKSQFQLFAYDKRLFTCGVNMLNMCKELIKSYVLKDTAFDGKLRNTFLLLNKTIWFSPWHSVDVSKSISKYNKRLILWCIVSYHVVLSVRISMLLMISIMSWYLKPYGPYEAQNLVSQFIQIYFLVIQVLF